MADNIVLNPGTGGDIVRATNVEGIKFQGVQIFNEFCEDLSQRLNDFITEDGLGVNNNIVGDFSGGNAKLFGIKPALNEVLIIRFFSLSMTATGASINIPGEGYGQVGTPLPVGIRAQILKISDNTPKFTTDMVVKRNRDWDMFLPGQAETMTESAGPDHYLRVTAPLRNICVAFADDSWLALKVNDNLTGRFDEHQVVVTGTRVPQAVFRSRFIGLDG